MSAIKLHSLTPEYREESHKVYLDAIEEALEDESIKNIALSGGYGVGKSSVLKKLASKNQKVVQVSLSSIGLPIGDGDGKETTTNRIQKEIVKQLLYREEPYKVPGSRFRRIAKFNVWRSISTAGLGGFALTLVFFLAGWTAKLQELFSAAFVDLWFQLAAFVDLWFQLAVFVVLSAGTLGVLALTHNRVAIKGLKVANAEIALTSEYSSYFDKFLDEIVYFFDVTEYEIVVFEDIDRFDDPYIFETLRALNTLLNNSKQLHTRRIRFIYAIKDSIFEEHGNRSATTLGAEVLTEDVNGNAVLAEMARTNRTKFFDLIIPVVPFITHKNARDLIGSLMDSADIKISVELIDLASRYLPEMRLITNVRNEFLIFREKVFDAKVGELKLRPDELFAMILYKNPHLSDFELIKTGESKLDQLYTDSRRLVRENIKRLTDEAAEGRRQRSNINSIVPRSEAMGEKLRDFLDRIGRINTPLLSVGSSYQVTISGVSYPRNDTSEIDFWQAISGSSNEESFHVAYMSGGSIKLNLSITKADLIAQMENSLSQSEWENGDRKAIDERLDSISKDQNFLSFATFENLYERNEFKTDEGLTFSNLVDTHFNSALVRQLVAIGFIDQNFSLYTSSYYTDRVSQRALNFMIHNIDRNVMDIDYQLKPEDVDVILSERGGLVLQGRGAYNISVLDHLLEKDDGKADRLLHSLKVLGDDEEEFFRAYLASGKYCDKLVERLTVHWDQIFDFLILRQDLDDEVKVSLVDEALKNVDASVDYVVDDGCRRFIEDNFSSLIVMRDASTTVELAQEIAALFSRAGVRLSSISELSVKMRNEVVATSCYKITFDNLEHAAESSDLALDQLQVQHPVVYDYMMKNLSEYLIAVKNQDADAVTVASSDSLSGVLVDVLENASNMLIEVLDGVDLSPGNIELISMPEEAWPALADRDAFPATFMNVKAYIESIGEIDEHIGGYLGRVGTIGIGTEAEDADRFEMAEYLLAAREGIPDPEIRVRLVVNLELESYLPISYVPSEDGPLIGLLVESEVIEDDEQSFGLTLVHDWATREFAISKSEAFVTYMTATEIPISDVPLLLRSTAVTSAVKNVLIARLDEFIPTDDSSALKAAAEYAVATKTRLANQQLLRVAGSDVGQDLAANLLAVAVTGMSIEELMPIFERFGGWLKALIARDGKRPKIVNSEVNRTIVQRLKDLGLVSSFKPKGAELEVNLKKP